MTYTLEIIKEYSKVDEIGGLYDALYQITAPIEETYANHKQWYYHKFLPELKAGEAFIIFLYKQDRLKPVGVSFIRTTDCKLCTLFVLQECRGKGFGEALLRQTVASLGRKPMVTVSESNFPKLQRLFAKVDFEVTYKVRGFYQKDEIEYCFNSSDQNQILSEPACNFVFDDVKNCFVPREGCEYSFKSREVLKMGTTISSHVRE